MFPLYDQLLTGCSIKKLKKIEVKDMIKKIDKMDSDAHEIIYILIYLYSLNVSKINELYPYNIKKNGNDINVQVCMLPNELLQLICKFICLHVNR